MPYINITVKNKIATAKKTTIICDNTDYTVRFTFDAEWTDLTAKTMRVVFGDGSYEEVVFTGTEATLPKAQKQRFLMVGVFSGNLHTTTPAWFPCEYSIKSSGAEHDPPSEDVYDQIIDLINTHFTTEVVANPTLAGTEATLTGLEVNGIKYAAGGGWVNEAENVTHKPIGPDDTCEIRLFSQVLDENNKLFQFSLVLWRDAGESPLQLGNFITVDLKDKAFQKVAGGPVFSPGFMGSFSPAMMDGWVNDGKLYMSFEYVSLDTEEPEQALRADEIIHMSVQFIVTKTN